MVDYSEKESKLFKADLNFGSDRSLSTCPHNIATFNKKNKSKGKKHHLNFDQINEAALNNIASILNRFAPGGRISGCEYRLRNPTRNDRKLGSFSINTTTAIWKDFATNDNGMGLISFVAYVQQLKYKEAAQQLSDHLGLTFHGESRKMNTTSTTLTNNCTKSEVNATPQEQSNNTNYDNYVIPENAPRPEPHSQLGVSSLFWSYKNCTGQIVQHIVRFELKDGDKTFRPLIYTAAKGWEWKTIPENRPLYNLDKLATETDKLVIIVEGEKAADAASALFPNNIVTTSIGGAEAAHKTDFSCLNGRSVVLWQDNDEAGEKYVNVITELLYKANVGSVQSINLDCLKKYALIPNENQKLMLADNPRKLPPKWDAADALAEGYTSDHLKELLEKPEFLITIPKASRSNNTKTKGRDSQQYKRAYNENTVIKGNGDGGERWGYTFTCDKINGVVYHKVTASGSEFCVESTPVCSFLEVVARVRNEDEKDWGRILKIHTINDTCHTWNISTDLLSGDGSELRKGLLNLGLDIKTGKYINNYLTQYISEAAKDLPLETCTNHLGWYGTSFILPDQVISANLKQQKIWYQSNFSIVNCYKQQGTLTEWQEHVGKYCVGNSRLVLAVCTTFAAPLLRLLGGGSMGFHFVGRSSIGKTKILNVAASVCGSRKYVRQWRHTDNALEGIANFHNDSTLVLDELSQANAEDFYRILYMLSNGAGKGRANCCGLPRDILAWKVLWISSGEVGLVGLLSEGKKKVKVGQQIRQVDIPAFLDDGYGAFENLHGLPFASKFADILDENSAKYYGTPFIEWLKALINIINKDESSTDSLTLKNMKQQHREFEAKLLTKYNKVNGQIARVASIFALLMVAGEYATKTGITNWPENAACSAVEKVFHEYMQDKCYSSAQEEIDILNHVKLFFETKYKSSFIRLDDNGGEMEDKVIYDAVGECKKTDRGYTFYLSPQQYDKHICAGQERKMVTETLIKKGWLLPETNTDGKKCKSSQLLYFSRLKSKKRVYVFDGSIMLSADLDQKIALDSGIVPC